MLGGVLFAFVFAEYLSPVGGIAGVILGVYLGAIPASAAFFASLSEFDLWGLVACRDPLAPPRRPPRAGRRRRRRAGTRCSPTTRTTCRPGTVDLDLEALWA